MTALCGKQAKILSDETAAHLIVSHITIIYPMTKSLIIMISLAYLNIIQVFTSSFVTLKAFCQKWDFYQCLHLDTRILKTFRQNSKKTNKNKTVMVTWSLPHFKNSALNIIQQFEDQEPQHVRRQKAFEFGTLMVIAISGAFPMAKSLIAIITLKVVNIVKV